MPVMIMGDLNIDPDASAVVQSAVRHGGWVDTAKICADARGMACDPTCFVRDTSQGSRIDAILCNSVARAALLNAGVLGTCALPTHRPVACSLTLDAYSQSAQKIRTPQAFPLDFLDPEADGEECTARRTHFAAVQ